MPMHTTLTLTHVLPLLAAQVDQLCRQQIADPVHSGYGAVVTSDDGRPSPGGTAALIVGGIYLICADAASADTASADAAGADASCADVARLPTLQAAADALLALQRPGGLVDLPTVNIDSGPDTAFIVQRLCTALAFGRAQTREDAAWTALLATVERFIRAAAPGMATGGFHTPNHRWVIASALAQSAALLSDLNVGDAIDAYLAEGIDVDAEGFFIERSIGVYDAVNTLGWLLLAEHWDIPAEALDAVGRNLDLDLHLLHADGTAETGLSHRQDYGVRTVPTRLIGCLLSYHRLRPTPRFVAAAHYLWRRADDPGDVLWLCYALLKGGDPPPLPPEAPDDFALYLPDNGIWRLRRGPLSVSAFQDATRLLSFGFGKAMLSGIRINQTYFGGACGHFISDALTMADDAVTLRSEGRGRPRRPGYELPLGSEVPPECWRARTYERAVRELPPATSELILREIEGEGDAICGLAVRYVTRDGMDGVAAQIALDFEPGGIWETADTRLQPRPGQVLFLKLGWGQMRYGTDVIRIVGGAYAHSMWAMRESPAPGDAVRVLLTFNTPVDHTVRLVGLTRPDAVIRIT
jgi:hypothetical protein